MAQDRSMVAVSSSVLPSEMPADLAAALADLFEAYSDARTDYGPAPIRPDIVTPEAAAVRAFEMIRERLAGPPPSRG